MSYTVDNNGSNGVLLVSTRQNPSEIIKTGGVLMPSARVNRNRIETTTKWVVCCDEVNHNAFLIGKIDRVLWVDNECIIKINEYAQINKEDVWLDYGAKKYAWTYLENPSVCKMRPGHYQFLKVNGTGNYSKVFAKTEAKPLPSQSEVKKSAPIVEDATISVFTSTVDLRAIIAKALGIDRKHIAEARAVIMLGQSKVTIEE